MNKENFFLTKLECFLVIIGLIMVDVGPIPVTAFGLLFILFRRPKWFKELIDHIYLNKDFDS
ncbi:MAG: hypothetical protein RIR23_1018 [Pseudomonadota bacterium]|jgi:hypothetical protein